MEDSSRFRLVLDEAPTDESEQSKPQPDDIPAVGRNSSPLFVGNAMKTLFEAAEVSITRGDETRVITKSDKRGVGPSAPDAEALPDELPSGMRGGPHVDLVLWLVLAAGLFGIAGWMLAHGL